jgi:hypothetical protein
MRTLRPFCQILTLAYVLVPGVSLKLFAQDSGACTTTSRRETYRDAKGNLELQKIEVKSVTPGLVVADFSVVSKKPIKLNVFWKLRRKAYIACAAYYEKSEKLEAQKEQNGPKPPKVQSDLR